MAKCFGCITAIFRLTYTDQLPSMCVQYGNPYCVQTCSHGPLICSTYIVCFIVVVYDVNLYINIIVTQRDGFRKASTNYFILHPNFPLCRIFFFYTLSAHKLFVPGLWIALKTNFKILLEDNSLDLIQVYTPPCSPVIRIILKLAASIK